MACESNRFFQPPSKKSRRTLLPYVACAPPGPDLPRRFFEEDEKEFVDRELAEIYESQPPWIYLRTVWPTNPKKRHPRGGTGADEITALYADIQRFPDIPAADWPNQTKEIHGFLTAPEERTRRSAEIPQDGLKGLYYGLSPGPEVFRTLTRKKRLFANFIFFKAHWTAVIWDRRFGQLYYFDSAQEQRMEHATQAVRL